MHGIQLGHFEGSDWSEARVQPDAGPRQPRRVRRAAQDGRCALFGAATPRVERGLLSLFLID